MNEKEIEKMRKGFISFITTAEGETMTVMMYTKTEEEIWRWIEKGLKEAYYQGYMAGTMEAL